MLHNLQPVPFRRPLMSGIKLINPPLSHVSFKSVNRQTVAATSLPIPYSLTLGKMSSDSVDEDSLIERVAVHRCHRSS